MSRCPVCNEPSVSRCRCPRSDSTCANGHKWHTCTVHHIRVLGHHNHAIGGMNICTCAVASPKITSTHGVDDPSTTVPSVPIGLGTPIMVAYGCAPAPFPPWQQPAAPFLPPEFPIYPPHQNQENDMVTIERHPFFVGLLPDDTIDEEFAPLSEFQHAHEAFAKAAALAEILEKSVQVRQDNLHWTISCTKVS